MIKPDDPPPEFCAVFTPKPAPGPFALQEIARLTPCGLAYGLRHGCCAAAAKGKTVLSVLLAVLFLVPRNTLKCLSNSLQQDRRDKKTANRLHIHIHTHAHVVVVVSFCLVCLVLIQTIEFADEKTRQLTRQQIFPVGGLSWLKYWRSGWAG